MKHESVTGVPEKEVLNRVRDWIEAEGLSPGDRVPSERELAARLGVGRGQVRSAYMVLEAQGELAASSPRIRIVARRSPAGGGSLGDTLAVISANQTPKPGLVTGSQEQMLFTAVAAAVHGASMNMLTIPPQHIGPAALRSLVASRPVGVVALGGVMSHDGGLVFLERLRAEGIPVAVVGDLMSTEALAMSGFDHVISDHERGARMLVEWLSSQNRRRILFLDSMDLRGKTPPSWYVRRLAGYRAACDEAGVELTEVADQVHHNHNVSFDGRVDSLAVGLEEHLTGRDAVDAVCLLTDGPYFAFAGACRRLGREPGSDLLVVGYDNYWAGCDQRRYEPTVPAATVDKRADILCGELVRMVSARAGGEAPRGVQSTVIAPELVVTDWPNANVVVAGAKRKPSRRSRRRS